MLGDETMHADKHDEHDDEDQDRHVCVHATYLVDVDAVALDAGLLAAACGVCWCGG